MDFMKLFRRLTSDNIIVQNINMYAYDAYFLDCAIRYKSPLLTLDRKLMVAAQNIHVETLEV